MLLKIEIMTFPPSLPRFSYWKFLYSCKNWIRIGCAPISGCKVLISNPCSRNRITFKVQLGKFSLTDKIPANASLSISLFANLFRITWSVLTTRYLINLRIIKPFKSLHTHMNHLDPPKFLLTVLIPYFHCPNFSYVAQFLKLLPLKSQTFQDS